MIARTELVCPDCGHTLDVRVIATGDDEIRVDTIPAHNLGQNVGISAPQDSGSSER